ncbi:TPA: hypothetical protein DDW35_01590 [Candidatus Sumerlaeota bacterium]|nr:hypothetical protein [Candidatus Sumerlaeota bacterium]
MGHAGTWLGYNRRAEFVGGAFSSFTSGINDANGITAYNVTTRPFEISGSNITAPLIPEIAYIPHPTISGRYAPFGTVPGVLFTNIKNLENEELITIGTDIYRVFPSRTRNVAHAGQYWGIAVLSPAE